MKRIVLIADFDLSVEPRFDRLVDHGFDLVRRHDLAGSATEAELIGALAGAWAVVAGNERYSSRVLDAAPQLRVIARPGAGYDGVDVGAATERGICVFTTPGTNHEAVADLTVGLMLAVLRRIALLDRTVRAGGWHLPGLARDLHGSTVGIAGLGLIGRAVVRRLDGFGCTFVASEPEADATFCAEHRIELALLPELAPRVDILSLHVPLTAATQHLVDAQLLGRMRSTAILINTSRGAVVDEAALVDALKTGRIGGAGLDVFESEPLPLGHPLTTFANVVVTSHVASHTTDAMIAMIDRTMEGILLLARGIAPRGSLNSQVVERAAGQTPTASGA